MSSSNKMSDLIFEYFCSVRNDKMVDALVKEKMGRTSDERYVFHKIHHKLEGLDDEEAFYESIKRELYGLMEKYENVLDEDTKVKAMGVCIESRLQCVLCKLRERKINFKALKNGIDRYFPDPEKSTVEYPGVEKFMAVVTYTKVRDTLMRCIAHGKGDEYIVKYAKSFFMDSFDVETYKTKVIKVLYQIEKCVKGDPELMTMFGDLNDAETKKMTELANLVRRAHDSPVVEAPLSEKKRKTPSSSKKSTKKKKQKKNKTPVPLKESTSSRVGTQDEDVEEKISEEISTESSRSAGKKSQDEKENAPQRTTSSSSRTTSSSSSSRRSSKKRKVIAHKEESVVNGLKKARARVARNDPIDRIVTASRIDKTGGEELEWTQTSYSEETEEEDDGRGKGPTPKKRGEEKFEVKKVKKKLDYKKQSFVTTTTTSSKKKKSKSTRKRVPWTKIEEEYLVAGVEKYKSSWATILEAYEFDERRTNVHLKDKWRNLVKKNPDLASKMGDN